MIKKELTVEDWIGLIKTQIKNYENQRDNFQRAIDRYESEGKVPDHYLAPYYMVKGNKGMIEFVIKDLKSLLK